MSDLASFARVWRRNGPSAAIIKALARITGRRVLIEGLDEDFPRPSPPRDLSMPTQEDALHWHTGYGGRWKHVLPLPNDRMMLHIGADSVDNFFFVGDAWAQVLSRHIGSGSHVLDIGCGCGRTARFLATNPHVARYTGFDVFAPYVEWCTRFFGELHPGRFNFHHIDVRTERYNPGGTLSCAAARFPAADGDVDVAYAASIFTHLYPDDARAYLAEMRRVLRNDGRAVVSFHDRPAPCLEFSGSEHRADYDVRYFTRLVDAAGFGLAGNPGRGASACPCGARRRHEALPPANLDDDRMRMAVRLGGWVALAALLMLVGPLLTLAFGNVSLHGDWRTATHRATGLAPDPAMHREAIVQVYASRTFGWRGAFAVHTWLAAKPRNGARAIRATR